MGRGGNLHAFVSGITEWNRFEFDRGSGSFLRHVEVFAGNNDHKRGLQRGLQKGKTL